MSSKKRLKWKVIESYGDFVIYCSHDGVVVGRKVIRPRRGLFCKETFEEAARRTKFEMIQYRRARKREKRAMERVLKIIL